MTVSTTPAPTDAPTSAVPDLQASTPSPRRVAAELAAPGVLLVFAAWVGVEARGLGYWTALGPGPGFFPMWIAGLLVVLALAWGIQVVIAGGPHEAGEVSTVPSETDTGPGAGGEADPGASPARVIGLLLGLLFVAWAIEVLGYQVTLMVFLIFLMKVLDRASWRLTVLVALLAGPGVYHLFADLLAVQLPLSSLAALRTIGL